MVHLIIVRPSYPQLFQDHGQGMWGRESNMFNACMWILLWRKIILRPPYYRGTPYRISTSWASVYGSGYTTLRSTHISMRSLKCQCFQSESEFNGEISTMAIQSTVLGFLKHQPQSLNLISGCCAACENCGCPEKCPALGRIGENWQLVTDELVEFEK